MRDPILALLLDLDPIPILVLVPDPMDTMIVQDLGPHGVEAMAEVIEKIAILTLVMREATSVGIMRINVSVSIILWYVLNGAFQLSYRCVMSVELIKNSYPRPPLQLLL